MAEWTALQIRRAFPFDTAPRFLIRDRDKTFGAEVEQAINDLGIEQRVTAPRSPWQNGLSNRLVLGLSRGVRWLADFTAGITAKLLDL